MTIKSGRVEGQILSLAALEDPVRRALYFQVIKGAGEVSRDQAARAAHVSRSLAAFHLDKLVEAGLLEATFRRLSKRSGPGAGRPSKLYRRAARQIDVTLPERRYELAGRLMTSALDARDAAAARDRLQTVALEWGKQLGAEARGRANPESASEKTLTRAMRTLREAGFEPERDGQGGIVLQNCPFDALARSSREVVCGMNLALIQGVVNGLEARKLEATLDPAPGRCCVVLRPKRRAQPGKRQ